jgi:peptidoglycan/xylan/chitin deacetylase (PgdA/CDA1 family)
MGALDIVTANQIAEMSRGPWEIASHGFRHVDLRTMEAGGRLKELIDARQSLSEITKKPVDALAYPYGEANHEVERAAAQAGYRSAFGAWPTRAGNTFRIPRTPIAGTDGMAVFRLKTSQLYRRIHPLYRLTPTGARERVRAVLNRVPRVVN